MNMVPTGGRPPLTGLLPTTCRWRAPAVTPPLCARPCTSFLAYRPPSASAIGIVCGRKEERPGSVTTGIRSPGRDRHEQPGQSRSPSMPCCSSTSPRPGPAGVAHPVRPRPGASWGLAGRAAATGRGFELRFPRPLLPRSRPRRLQRPLQSLLLGSSTPDGCCVRAATTGSGCLAIRQVGSWQERPTPLALLAGVCSEASG